MLRVSLAVASALIATADAFVLPSDLSVGLRTANARSASTNIARTLRATSADEGTARRDFLRQLCVSAFGASSLAVQGKNAFAFQYDAKEGSAAREAYLEDVKTLRKARWTRQPTRLDVDRNVKRIVAIHDVMVDAEDALKNSDLKAVAEAIGDQSIEATKKNINLGLPIPDTQKAKPYMYGYAQLFSKKQDSPLTADLKAAADTFFASLVATRAAALAGDAEGTTANFAAAKGALQSYVDAIEAETLKGRINTIKVSVSGLVGIVDPEGNIDVAAENAKAVKGGRGQGFL